MENNLPTEWSCIKTSGNIVSSRPQFVIMKAKGTVQVAIVLSEDDAKLITQTPTLLVDKQRLTEELEELKAAHQLALADAQFQGFYAGRTEGNIIRLIEAMGLTKDEWIKWKDQFPSYPLERELEEVEEFFSTN